MDVDPTLVDGEVGGALEEVGGAPVVVVGGVLLQGEAVDPAHDPHQVLYRLSTIYPEVAVYYCLILAVFFPYRFWWDKQTLR
jgi:hypothetical protein